MTFSSWKNVRLKTIERHTKRRIKRKGKNRGAERRSEALSNRRTSRSKGTGLCHSGPNTMKKGDMAIGRI